MAHLIDKDVLVAEIERLARCLPKEEGLSMNLDWARNTLSCLYGFINTLEAKEVDLQEEINNEWEKCNPIDEGMGVESAFIYIEAFDMIARHFFELGLKAKQ